MGTVVMAISTKTVNVRSVMIAVTRVLVQVQRTVTKTVQMDILPTPGNVKLVTEAVTHVLVLVQRTVMVIVVMGTSTGVAHVMVHTFISEQNFM